MATLKVLGSSSSGNGYILLDASGHSLIIEAGCPLREARKALNFNSSLVDGVIVTHRHGDHSKYLSEYVNAGIPCYTSSDVASSRKINANIVESGVKYNISERFSVMPLSVKHDVPCLAFIIYSEGKRFLFVTDTVSFPYSVKCHSFMVEANYADDILCDNLHEGIIEASQYKRIMTSHMSFDTALDIVKKSFIKDNCWHVVLIHLSDRNSDEKRFVREMKKATGAPVTAAAPGVEINCI
jgi:phosphoribosyl 1,2-cyclic phosphodiesterase